jgi:hypothetical protein
MICWLSRELSQIAKRWNMLATLVLCEELEDIYLLR